MTIRVTHHQQRAQKEPWELINGFLFPPGTYKSLWKGTAPEVCSVVRLKCLLDSGPAFLWGTHPTSGSWGNACPHRRRAGMTVVPVRGCKLCMIDAGADGLLAELMARQPSSLEVRLAEAQASEVEVKRVGDVRVINPSRPKPHPRSPGWLTPQWEPPS